jgi:hypothetical protein
VFLSVLNDDIQFQLLNTDYADFQHIVDKAIVIENKIREMEKDGKRKVSFFGQSSGSNVRPPRSSSSIGSCSSGTRKHFLSCDTWNTSCTSAN